MLTPGAGSSEDASRLRPLRRQFFARPTADVARDLLGMWLWRESAEGPTGGPIVETEAYGGPEDLASHARAGRTRRTTPMFGLVGQAYVYLIYGMHECLNVVAYQGADAGAVLIRALSPAVGVGLMRQRRRRPVDAEMKLCAGPARLCQAMAVDRSFDGHDLTAGDLLWIAQPPAGAPRFGGEISQGTRIGVHYARNGWAARPWRYWVNGHPAVSRG